MIGGVGHRCALAGGRGARSRASEVEGCRRSSQKHSTSRNHWRQRGVLSAKTCCTSRQKKCRGQQENFPLHKASLVAVPHLRGVRCVVGADLGSGPSLVRASNMFAT